MSLAFFAEGGKSPANVDGPADLRAIVDFSLAISTKPPDLASVPVCDRLVCHLRRKSSNQFACLPGRRYRRSCAAKCRPPRFEFLPVGDPRHHTCIGFYNEA